MGSVRILFLYLLRICLGISSNIGITSVKGIPLNICNFAASNLKDAALTVPELCLRLEMLISSSEFENFKRLSSCFFVFDESSL